MADNLLNREEPGLEISSFGEMGDVIIREAGIIDGFERSVKESATDECFEFFSTDMRRAGTAENLPMGPKKIGCCGKKAHIGFFCCGDLSLR